MFQIWNKEDGMDTSACCDDSAKYTDDSIMEDVVGKVFNNETGKIDGNVCHARFKPGIWRKYLQVAIDGDFSGNSNLLQNYTGATEIQGHVRNLRGNTILNSTIDNSENRIDISYSKTVEDLSRIALDVYGGIYVKSGTTFDGTEPNYRLWTINTTGTQVSASNGDLFKQNGLVGEIS